MLSSVLVFWYTFKQTVKKILLFCRHEGVSGVLYGIKTYLKKGHYKPIQGSSRYDRNDYAEWIRRYDTLTAAQRTQYAAQIAALQDKPLISIVLFTHNAKADLLKNSITSVLQQIYPEWQLCIVDQSSNDSKIQTHLITYAAQDSRISLIKPTEDACISVALNQAIAEATGKWVLFLDPADRLSENALFCLVEKLVQYPEAALVYSDEDCIDDKEHRSQPYFKSDWNVDLFYSQNILRHFVAYKTDLLIKINGFNPELEPEHHYDLALRAIEQIKPGQIQHISRVLYHRYNTDQNHHGQNASIHTGTPAGVAALNAHFQHRQINAHATAVKLGYRVHYALPDPVPRVSLIIPTRNHLALVKQCIDSIQSKTVYPDYEILIIDNGSDDPAILDYFQKIQANPQIRVIRDDRPFNYSELNNLGVAHATGDLIGLINNDITVISPNWLNEMVSFAIQPEIGAVGAQLWYPNDRSQHSGIILGINGWAEHAHKHTAPEYAGYFGRRTLISGYSAVTAACLIVRKALFIQVGGLDAVNLKVAGNDIDLCLRLHEAGYRNVWTPYAELYHHESATRGYENSPEKKKRFANELHYMRQRWGALLDNDPAYNPNLTLNAEDFSLAWPPRQGSDSC